MRIALTFLAILSFGFESAPRLTAAEVPLGYAEAATLGLVEGITEYLPVSSTGHLILVNYLLGLDEKTPLTNKEGTPVMHTVHGEETPFTLVEAANTYIIGIQGGAIMAVLLLYWREILRIILGFLGKDPEGRRLGINIILAFIPAATLGLLMGHWIEAHLFNPVSIAYALALGAVAILLIEKKLPLHGGRSFFSLKPREALVIGILQCLSLWPGTSRSLTTLVGGVFVGLSRTQAACFSFLLGFVVLMAASIYKLYSVGKIVLEVFEPGPFILGFVVTTLAAFASVKWLIGYLGRHNLKIFAYYRLVLAALIFIYAYQIN